jgi:hypothetical protein
MAAAYFSEMCSVEERVLWDAWVEKMRGVNYAIRVKERTIGFFDPVRSVWVTSRGIFNPVRSAWLTSSGARWGKNYVGHEKNALQTRPGYHCYLCYGTSRAPPSKSVIA